MNESGVPDYRPTESDGLRRREITCVTESSTDERRTKPVGLSRACPCRTVDEASVDEGGRWCQMGCLRRAEQWSRRRRCEDGDDDDGGEGSVGFDMARDMALSQSPSPSSHSSMSGSSQKRKRSHDKTEFMANSNNNNNINNHNSNGSQPSIIINPAVPLHPFAMPHSMDSQQTAVENPGSSLEDEDDGENGGGQHHASQSDGVKNGQSYGRFEGVNGGDGDEEEDDDEEEGDAIEEDGEHDDGKTLNPDFLLLIFSVSIAVIAPPCVSKSCFLMYFSGLNLTQLPPICHHDMLHKSFCIVGTRMCA